MTIKIIAAFLISLAMVGTSHAARNMERKPNLESETINLKVVYGEKTTNFTIVPKKSGARVDFFNNQGSHSAKDISADDFTFLKSKVNSLSGPSNDLNYCTRRYISISMGTKYVIGCLGAKNRLAKDTQNLANLLAILF